MNFFYFWLGLAVLIINKTRYSFFGYNKPRDFSVEQIEKALDYDFRVVDNWLKILKEKFNEELKEKNILELGPGADLGPGLILLSKGANKYYAFDANNLIKETPVNFYDKLFSRLGSEEFKKDLQAVLAGGEGRLNYVVDKNFSLKIFKDKKINLIFSQAAFEHFSDFKKVVRELSRVVPAGAKLIAEIDFKTHTSILKNDPLNIYRYPNFIYKLFNFPGLPNRLKPSDYNSIFKINNWDVEIFPLVSMENDKFNKVKNSLSASFCGLEEMKILSAVLIANKK